MHATHFPPSHTGVAAGQASQAAPQWVPSSQGRHAPFSQCFPDPQSADVAHSQLPLTQYGVPPPHTPQLAPQWLGSPSPHGSHAPPEHHAPGPHCTSAVHRHCPSEQTGCDVAVQSPQLAPQWLSVSHVAHLRFVHQVPPGHDALLHTQPPPMHEGVSPAHAWQSSPHAPALLHGEQFPLWQM